MGVVYVFHVPCIVFRFLGGEYGSGRRVEVPVDAPLPCAADPNIGRSVSVSMYITIGEPDSTGAGIDDRGLVVAPVW